jgi:S1-C subfamily serine protease
VKVIGFGEVRSDLQELRDVLATLYEDVSSSRIVAQAAGINTAFVRFDTRAAVNWHSILEEASKHSRGVERIIERALQDYPSSLALLRVAVGRVDPSLTWKGGAKEQDYEAIISHQSSLVPISFLELGLARARAVALIRSSRNGRKVTATGFLIENNRLVTNWHVLRNKVEAASAEILLDYHISLDGILAPVSFKLDPNDFFFSSEADDLTIVRICDDPNRLWGGIPLHANSIEPGGRVNIIQHPMGRPKELSYFHNVVAYADDRRIQYLTDTEPGSSGGPVFNADWDLVAIHHAGGWMNEPGRAATFYRNEGIAVRVLLDILEG